MTQMAPSETVSDTPIAEQHVIDECAPPAGASEFAMWMGVTIIGVMFAAGCIAYALVRQHTRVSVDVPMVFWFSTGVINISSAFLYYAMLSAKVSHRTATRRSLDVSTLLAITFLVLQIPGLQQIVLAHHDAVEAHIGIYAAMLVLVSLHAAHVLIGLIAMLLVTRRVHRERSQDHLGSIRLLSIYWHALTVIWLGMFSLLIYAR